ncbi:hypothetical protein GC194_07225 [bacterium]|nr:hypothetical protein [bacterium]
MKILTVAPIILLLMFNLSYAQNVWFSAGTTVQYEGFKQLNKFVEVADFQSLKEPFEALELELSKVLGSSVMGFRYTTAHAVSDQNSAGLTLLKTQTFSLVYSRAIDAEKKLNLSPVFGYGFGIGNLILSQNTEKINQLNSLNQTAVVNAYQLQRNVNSLFVACRAAYQLLEHEYVFLEAGAKINFNNENYTLANNDVNLQRQLYNGGTKLGFSPYISFKLALY